MRYFPVGRRIPDAVSLKNLEVHPSATRVSQLPPILITGPESWGYCAFLPVTPPGPGHLFIRVSLSVEQGRIGVALQRQDETIVEQLGLPDRMGNTVVSFFVDKPEDCHHLLFRNWGHANGPSKFTIEEVEVRPAFREMTLAQFRSLGQEDWVLLDRPWLRYLEFHLLDFCNLNCPFCSHGTPEHHRGDQYISLDQLKSYSRFFEANEFDALKVAGGEPSLHPEFRQICRHLRQLFVTLRADLSSNGARLMDFLDCIDCFDWIDVSHYPGKNDASFEQLSRLGRPNIFPFVKRDGQELFDSRLEPHRNHVFVFENCSCSCTKMIAKDRIFDCPGTYGQIPNPKNFSPSDSGVPVGPDWRKNLAALDIEPCCKRCFWPADAPRIVDAEFVEEEWKLPKSIGHRLYNNRGEVVREAVPVAPSLSPQGLVESLWVPPQEQPYEKEYYRPPNPSWRKR